MTTSHGTMMLVPLRSLAKELFGAMMIPPLDGSFMARNGNSINLIKHGAPLLREHMLPTSQMTFHPRFLRSPRNEVVLGRTSPSSLPLTSHRPSPILSLNLSLNLGLSLSNNTRLRFSRNPRSRQSPIPNPSPNHNPNQRHRRTPS